MQMLMTAFNEAWSLLKQDWDGSGLSPEGLYEYINPYTQDLGDVTDTNRFQNMGFGANRFALIGDETVQKIPQDFGRGQPKSDLAMINALATLGFPIMPETPIAPTDPRFFPTEQELVSQSFKDLDAGGVETYGGRRSLRPPSKEYEQFQTDLDALDDKTANTPLGQALDLGDIGETEANTGFDLQGNLVGIDPFIGAKFKLRDFGRNLQEMAAPIGSNTMYQQSRVPTYNAGAQGEERYNNQVFQGFKQVDPMQLDNFTQLYLDRNQFKPWNEAEKVLFNNPESFGEKAPSEAQLQQLREKFASDDAQYRDIGAALQFMNTPPEQKRLFEFGDTPHARRYRNMLNSLNYNA